MPLHILFNISNGKPTLTNKENTSHHVFFRWNLFLASKNSHQKWNEKNMHKTLIFETKKCHLIMSLYLFVTIWSFCFSFVNNKQRVISHNNVKNFIKIKLFFQVQTENGEKNKKINISNIKKWMKTWKKNIYIKKI